ncbi:dethiobiotin synthase [Luteipulveratus halotolerans]|uniref:ATP-dependent dethiobiotin synthetase BioD n=1 Tax=Luteipulveratus halotolerans TaxID=1631356 RepID=A0A0L6CMJ6_9MICO|nr:dethiobiotin synthase [Luteipulveratus halotolerans]KNX38773.1 hypothetical protein VV01_19120 [Luteipulveratus halotolerans]
MSPAIVVTGTDTEVGKTVATAALASALTAAGRRVHAYKPVQTGVAHDDEGDLPFVRRVAGVPVTDGVRLREPMAPVQAASVESRQLPPVAEHAQAVRRLLADPSTDDVLVEGAGGLLVELDDDRATLADLAADLDATVVVVVRAGLGTLNHTMLTLEALRARGLRVGGVIVGSYPQQPAAVERANLAHLTSDDAIDLLGVLPSGAGSWNPAEFGAAAPSWLPSVLTLVARRPVG